MEADFRVFFQLFTASVRSQKPGPTLVPGVFFYKVLSSEILSKIGDICMTTICIQHSTIDKKDASDASFKQEHGNIDSMQDCQVFLDLF